MYILSMGTHDITEKKVDFSSRCPEHLEAQGRKISLALLNISWVSKPEVLG